MLPTSTTTDQRPTLHLLGSDHPHFRAGQQIAAVACGGNLIRLGLYTVYQVAIDRPAGRVVIQTAQEYFFVATLASYDALMAQPAAQAVPRWTYTDRARPPRYFAEYWQQNGGIRWA